MSLPCRSEAAEQEAVAKWARTIGRRLFPELRLLIHIPNGEKRQIVTAKRLKRQGVTPGVSDLFLPVPRRDPGGRVFFGLWIEMKRRDGGSGLSDDQAQWIIDMRSNGYAAGFACGSDAAIATLTKYLNLRRLAK